MPRVTLEQARAAKQAVLRHFEGAGATAAVGITRIEGEYAVKVNLAYPVEPGTDVPTEIEGVAVCVEITGPVRAR